MTTEADRARAALARIAAAPSIPGSAVSEAVRTVLERYAGDVTATPFTAGGRHALKEFVIQLAGVLRDPAPDMDPDDRMADAKMEEVQSSNVARIGHDSHRRMMFVEFKDGGVYEYPGIDAATFKKIKTSASVGRALSTYRGSRFR